jgi:hypothetical protein
MTDEGLHVSERPYEDALHTRWTLEGRIPLTGVADGASWHRARTVVSGDPVTLFVVAGDQALEVADAARRAYLVENARLIAVQEVEVLEDVPTPDGPTTLTVVQYGMPPAPPLAALLSEGPMRPETIRSIIGEAATGLEAARHRGLRHQFLDSNRLFVDTAEDTVTVLGVGVEAAAHPDAEDDSRTAAFQDTAALVSLLFRGLTGTAPGRLSGTRIPRPSTLVERRIPEDLDVLCDLVLNGDGGDMPTTTRELVAELGPWQSIPVTLEAYDPDQAAAAPPAAGPSATATAAAGASAASASGVAAAPTSGVAAAPASGAADAVSPATPASSAPLPPASSDAATPSTPGPTPDEAPGRSSDAAAGQDQEPHADQAEPSQDDAAAAQEFVQDLQLDQRRSESSFPGHVDLGDANTSAADTPSGTEDSASEAGSVGSGERDQRDESAPSARPVPGPGSEPDAEPEPSAAQGSSAQQGTSAEPQQQSALASDATADAAPHSSPNDDQDSAAAAVGTGAAASTQSDPEATSVLGPTDDEPAELPAHGPIIVRGRDRSVMTPADPEPEQPERSGAPAGRSSLFRDVVDVAMADEAPDNAYAAATAPREERSRQSQWIIVGAALLVIVALVFAVTSITSGLRDQAAGPTKTTAAPTSAAPSEDEDDDASEKPKETKKKLPDPKVDTDGVEGFAEGGNQKADYSEQAGVLTDGDDSTQWKTKIYQTPQFGNLKDGLGFRIPFDKKSDLSKVTVTTAENSGGKIELYQLKDDGTRGDKLADGEFAGDGDVELKPKKSVDSSGVVVWISELPQGSQGYRAEINEISVE